MVEAAEIPSGIVSKHSSSRITSRALAPKAKAQAKAEKDVETEKPESPEEPKEHNNVFLDDQVLLSGARMSELGNETNQLNQYESIRA